DADAGDLVDHGDVHRDAPFNRAAAPGTRRRTGPSIATAAPECPAGPRLPPAGGPIAPGPGASAAPGPLRTNGPSTRLGPGAPPRPPPSGTSPAGPPRRAATLLPRERRDFAPAPGSLPQRTLPRRRACGAPPGVGPPVGA